MDLSLLAVFDQFDSLAVPGAGLRHLDFSPEVQSMFEDLMVPASGDVSRATLATEPVPVNMPSQDPSRATETPLGYIPKSPISLAISAILALVPHPKDPNPSSPESVLLRRSYAQWFSKASLDSVEAESDLAESAANPSQALLNEHPVPKRPSLHPHVPVELEAVLALLILSVYEYAQRGNLVKMRHRAGQAFVTAMNMSLHALPPEDNIYSEAKRRAWWMTPPTIILNDPRFVTPFPRFASDPEGWSILMRAQHALVAGTQFILDLNQALKARGNMSYIYERMKKVDAWIRPVLAHATTTPSMPPLNGMTDSESITAQSIRKISLLKLSSGTDGNSAHIKTHRFRAFLDIPIFIKKHCDLTCASIGYLGHEADAQGSSKLCCASTNLSNIPTIPPSGQSPSSCSTTSDVSGATTSSSTWVNEDAFPFTNHESTEICLNSALTIAHMFRTLPYPTPIYDDKDLVSISPRSRSPSDDPASALPRTMPSFACCAMQSSYAMLMLYYKSRVIDHTSSVEGNPLKPSDDLADELQYGLECVISAVRNYSIAFEALDGMRG
ncbi:hypothetical protein RJZ90_005649 [Blastomyces dermatitidis]